MNNHDFIPYGVYRRLREVVSYMAQVPGARGADRAMEALTACAKLMAASGCKHLERATVSGGKAVWLVCLDCGDPVEANGSDEGRHGNPSAGGLCPI